MADSSNTTNLLEPTPPRERIPILDVLRGFALFGVLVANMRGFASPVETYFMSDALGHGAADRMAQSLVDLFVSGKFITLFSFLFGLGFAVQMSRAEAKGARFAPVFRRRLLVLLFFGLSHALLLWWGDILAPYAVIGFLLFIFGKRSQKTVLVWAVVTMLFPLFIQIVFLCLARSGIDISGPPPPDPAAIRETIRVYSQGTFAEIMRVRMRELAFAYTGMVFFFSPVLGKFLLGLYAWRRGIFQNLPEHLSLWSRILKVGLPVGLLSNLLAVIVMRLWNPDPIKPTVAGIVVNLGFTVGMPALSAFYAAALVFLFQRETWRRRLQPLAAVGRMALTNYLMQSVLCTTLFYSYGIGLYGRVGPALCLVPAFLIFLGQVPLSMWWLRRFRLGPVEWLWRSLTYGRAQPLAMIESPAR